MDNNKVQQHRPSPVNRYLEIAKQTSLPLAVYFADGEVIDNCVIMEMDSLNLLVRIWHDMPQGKFSEAVLNRSTIKKITSAAEHQYAGRGGRQ